MKDSPRIGGGFVTSGTVGLIALSQTSPLFAGLFAGASYLSIIFPGLLLASSWQGLWLARDYLHLLGGGLVAGLALAVIAVVVSGQVGKAKLAASRFLPLTIFCGIALMSVVYNPWSPGASERPFGLVFGIAVLVCVAVAAQSRAILRQYLFGLALIGSVLSFSEVLRVAEGGAVHAELVSFELNPIDLGRITGLGALAALAWFHLASSSAASRSSQRLVAVVLTVSCVAGTLVSGSRGPIVALTLSGLWLLWRSERTPRLAKFLAYVVVLPIAYWGLQQVDVSSQGRQSGDELRRQAWSAALTAIQTHPLLGTGMGRYQEASHSAISVMPFPHNLPLEIGAELGLIALIAVLYVGISAWRAGGFVGRLFLLFASVCVMFSGNLGQSHLWWAAVGLCLATISRPATESGTTSAFQPKVSAL